MFRDLNNAFGVRPLVLDGALGTVIEGRGVNTTGKSWTARAVQTHAKLIYSTHCDYLYEGADIITANTFRTNPRALQGTDLDAEQLTKRAVRIARKARRLKRSEARVAASVAPVEDCFSPELAPPSDGALVEEHRVMMKWLVESRVDIILIETMSTLREALCALTAAREETEGTNIYTWVSIVPKDGETMLDGTPLETAVQALAAGGAHLVALNCAPVSTMLLAKERFCNAASHANVWFGVYPNSSERTPQGGWDLQASTTKDIVACVYEYMNEGAVMVGGCCGTTPETICSVRMKRDYFFLGVDSDIPDWTEREGAEDPRPNTDIPL